MNGKNPPGCQLDNLARGPVLGVAVILALPISAASANKGRLPAVYFDLMKGGIGQVEQRLDAEPSADLPLKNLCETPFGAS